MKILPKQIRRVWWLRLCSTVAVGTLLILVSAHSFEARSADEAIEAGDAEVDENGMTSDQYRIKTLIELLASKNSVEKGDETPPPGYKMSDQVVVFLAIQQLLQEGDTAFDSLIEHFGDKRYSVTIELPSTVIHYSVGDICSMIVDRGIYCYDDFGLLKEISADQHQRLDEEVEVFWRRNRKTPLWKIQVDMIDRQIDLFKKLDLVKMRPAHPYLKKPPTKTLEEARARNIAKLEALKASIVAMKSPYRPKSIDETWGMLIWLPWRVVSQG